MYRFLARCPDCGRQTLLDTANLRLLTPLDPRRSACAVFTCPACSQRASVPVGQEVVEALSDCGVPLSHGHPSMGPPPGEPVGPPIGHDDLLDLHLLLEQPDWFERLVEATGPAGLAS